MQPTFYHLVSNLNSHASITLYSIFITFLGAKMWVSVTDWTSLQLCKALLPKLSSQLPHLWSSPSSYNPEVKSQQPNLRNSLHSGLYKGKSHSFSVLWAIGTGMSSSVRKAITLIGNTENEKYQKCFKPFPHATVLLSQKQVSFLGLS